MEKKSNILYIVHGLLIFQAILHGSHYVAAQTAIAEIGSFPLISIRMLMCALLFWIAAVKVPKPQLSKSDVGLIVLSAVTGASTNVLFFYSGLGMTTANNAALIMTTTPVIVFILSVLLRREKMTWLKSIGILLGFGGLLILKIKTLKTLEFTNAVGDLFIFINAFFFGVYLVVVKPIMQKHNPLYLCKWIFLVGGIITTVVSLIIAPEQFSSIQVSEWELWLYALLLFMAVGLTFFPFYINSWALQHVDSTVVGAYLNLQPLTAGVITFLLTSQKPSYENYIAAPIVITGVYLVSRKTKN